MTKATTGNLFEFSFGEDFLRHHAGQIVTDQNFAIIELIANCWDAGATQVYIKWPDHYGTIEIFDNGIGMTKDELLYRWGKLNYNRLEEQGGKHVIFPKNTSHGSRAVFGRNGVGRHAMFCFSNKYEIFTQKDSEYTHANIERTIDGTKPFDVTIVENKRNNKESGTRIVTYVNENSKVLLPQDKIIELIGSKFISDPQFTVTVNNHVVEMTDISHLTESFKVKFGRGEIDIKRILGEKGKNTKQNGVAWWINNRLVGTPNWNTPDGHLIDGRHPIAKRLLYIINTDLINPKNVKKDWSGFYVTEEIIGVSNAVYEFIREDIRNLLYETRKERRLLAYENNRSQLANLPSESKDVIVHFLEDVQSKCPTIGTQELETTVEVLVKMEKARSGYALLDKLALYSPDDIDNLNEILDEWSIDDAKKVLGELRWRLNLISKLDSLLEDLNADELHDLQPLFERGLWIFGPEFESISFISNRSLSTVIKNLLGDKVNKNNAKRPDFVFYENSSIGVYSSDSFDEGHEINEFNKVVIVELKKAGIPIESEQKDQALYYARELRKSKKVSLTTPILAYVLGSEISPEANEEYSEGPIKIIPLRYNVILNKAHSRTFNLMRKIEEIKEITYSSEIDEIFNGSSDLQLNAFTDIEPVKDGEAPF